VRKVNKFRLELATEASTDCNTLTQSTETVSSINSLQHSQIPASDLSFENPFSSTQSSASWSFSSLGLESGPSQLDYGDMDRAIATPPGEVGDNVIRNENMGTHTRSIMEKGKNQNVESDAIGTDVSCHLVHTDVLHRSMLLQVSPGHYRIACYRHESVAIAVSTIPSEENGTMMGLFCNGDGHYAPVGSRGNVQRTSRLPNRSKVCFEIQCCEIYK
jgi:hypothetical protein